MADETLIDREKNVERIALADADATAQLGARIAREITQLPGGVVFLRGPLGAGKTCLARGLLRALGVTGAVRSPTFTLMELYELSAIKLLHLDLYRLAGAEELYGLGLADYATDDWWWLVEWPERGLGGLPAPWLDLRLEVAGAGRTAFLSYARR
ncbi:MAG TPA: tRNA (adenosine(37)-N6)-threonylcarbamoyltransferase complex ATPase subunit type 1 TsaE [Nevskiaceae bacterium]|nr:tRNA (adenosine(37)-N6)-threonylcarbamoyltransferase complex ATPase subunit type 1 TsaE [Nevskiaceae bacterium]